MTLEIGLVLLVIGAASVLLITEKLRVDVVGILVMVAVAWLGLVTPQQAFSGLASNAVVAVIAVMILSSGLDRAGVTVHLTGPILRLAGKSESRLLALVSATVGSLSAFMQNVGAAALFLPALMRLSTFPPSTADADGLRSYSGRNPDNGGLGAAHHPQ